MKRFSMVVALALFTVVLAAGPASPALADEVDFDAHWSGSLSRTASDLVDDTGNGAGARATVSDLTQKGTLGQSTVRVVAETSTLPAGYPASARCSDPAFFVEFPFLAHSSVTRVSSTGDLIYTLLDEGSLCLNPVTGQFTFEVDVNVVGGTGRFAQATGAGTASGGGNILLFAADGSAAFASLDGDTSLRIFVPDEE